MVPPQLLFTIFGRFSFGPMPSIQLYSSAKHPPGPVSYTHLALVSTVGSALNALSTVFTMDIYVKKIRPQAKQREIIRVGQVVTVVGALISVIITIAIDSIKGLNLFNVFQSVLGFIAPPMAAVFLFGVFWLSLIHI